MRAHLMRVVLLAGIAASCTVDTTEPDAGRKCDSTHECPPGQTCGADGRCFVGGAGGGATAGGSPSAGGSMAGGMTAGGAAGGMTAGGAAGGMTAGGAAGGMTAGGAAGGMTAGGAAGGMTAGGAAGGMTAGGAAGGMTAGGAAGGMTAGGSAGGATAGGMMDPDAGFPPNFFVDVAAGNDSNPGTQAFPWQTAGKVNSLTAAQLPPGSTVRFQGGQTWNERLIPPSSGDAGAVITYSTYGTGVATFNGTGNPNTGLDVRNRAYLSFSNLRVQNFRESFCAYLESVDHLTFTDVELSTCAEGYHASPSGQCDDVTVLRGNLHDFGPFPDGGTAGNHYAFSLPTTCDRWSVTDTSVQRCQKSCVFDTGNASSYLRLNAQACGLAPSGTKTGLSLGGGNAAVRYSTVTGAGASCVSLTGNGSAIEANQLSKCDISGITIQAGASGTHVIRRNRVWDSHRGISFGTSGTGATANISNNSVLGGQTDGGTTEWAFIASAGNTTNLENNLSTGPMTFALVVTGLDAGGASEGYVERANWFDTTALQQLQWNGATVTPMDYLTLSTQGMGSQFAMSAQLTSTSPVTPNFTPTNMAIRNTGVTDPASGMMAPNCDGGIADYCEGAPEPGAVELP